MVRERSRACQSHWHDGQQWVRHSVARSPPSTTTTRTAAVCSSTRSRWPTRPWPPRDTFAGIDRELALCGALLHDIGKLDAYSGDACGVSLNDAGRLIGEIPSGYYTVRRAIEQIPGFPPKRRPGAASHHPLAPRLLRARQPGAPVNPRGARGARDGQAQRRPRQL